MNKVLFNTAGDGYWSNTAAAVEITDMQLGYVNDDVDFGELRVYFNTETWNVEQVGLIYTDSKFLSQLQGWLCEQGIDGNDVDYSEQGMQGVSYVSLDVGAAFLASWGRKFGVELAALALV